MVDHPNPVVPSWYIQTLDGNKRYPTKGVGVSDSSGGTPLVDPSHYCPGQVKGAPARESRIGIAYLFKPPNQVVLFLPRP